MRGGQNPEGSVETIATRLDYPHGTQPIRTGRVFDAQAGDATPQAHERKCVPTHSSSHHPGRVVRRDRPRGRATSKGGPTIFLLLHGTVLTNSRKLTYRGPFCARDAHTDSGFTDVNGFTEAVYESTMPSITTPRVNLRGRRESSRRYARGASRTPSRHPSQLGMQPPSCSRRKPSRPE